MGNEKKHYTKNYLTNVIFKIDFPSISELNTTKLKEFQKLVKGEFPILQEQKRSGFGFDLGDNQIFEAKGLGNPLWIFVSKDNTKKVSIINDNIILESTKYDSFEELYPKIELLVNSLFQVFPEIISTRLGLRYINEVSLNGSENPYDLSNYINKNLIKSLDFFDVETAPLSRYINSAQIKGDDFNLTFKFGIPNSLYPNKIIKKEFTLDYDCFTTDTLEKEDILRKVKEFNDRITKLFEESIEEGLREEMEVVK